MDVKQRNDELKALRQQVEALTSSRAKLRRYTQELEKLYPGDTTIIREWLEVTHDDLLDPVPASTGGEGK